jgi:hypothetical protein
LKYVLRRKSPIDVPPKSRRGEAGRVLLSGSVQVQVLKGIFQNIMQKVKFFT